MLAQPIEVGVERLLVVALARGRDGGALGGEHLGVLRGVGLGLGLLTGDDVELGHRVVLVVATRGENGEVEPGFLEPGESLAQRRVEETRRAAEVLGVARVEFLGYVDSGMAGTPENDAPGSFLDAAWAAVAPATSTSPTFVGRTSELVRQSGVVRRSSAAT